MPKESGLKSVPTGGSVSSLFAPLTEQAEYTRAMFYGREGTGKTTAALLATQGGRVVVINAEGGLKKKPLADQGVVLDNVQVFTPDEGQLITTDDLATIHTAILAELQENPGSIYAVVMDSVTEIQKQLLETATHQRVTKSLVEVDPDFIDRADYGKTNNQLSKLIRRYRDLPCHFVATALERDKDNEDEVGPAMSPGLMVDVLGYMDVVVRFGSADGSFRGRAKGNKRIRAKDRFGALPEVIAEPSFPRIEAYLDGSLTDEDDELQQEMRDKALAETPNKKKNQKEN